MKLSNNFNLSEFLVSKDYPEIASRMRLTNEDVLNLQLLCYEILQPIRNTFGVVKVNSGFANTELNAKIGRNIDTDHGLGCACDFSVLNFNNEQVFKWIVENSEIKFRQCIYYVKTKGIHVSRNSLYKPFKTQALVCTEPKVYQDYNSYYGG